MVTVQMICVLFTHMQKAGFLMTQLKYICFINALYEKIIDVKHYKLIAQLNYMKMKANNSCWYL